MNIVVISGNLGHNPELRYTAGGTAVCEFSIAHNQYRGSGDERTKKTHWVRVKVFGKQAEVVAEHRDQGDEVIVHGRLDYSEWTGDDGTKRNVLKVLAADVKFGRSRSTGTVAANDADDATEAA